MSKQSKKPITEYNNPDYPIPDSMQALFEDFEDLIRSEFLNLEDEQIELALELFSFQLYSNYAVLYSPHSIHPTIQ